MLEYMSNYNFDSLIINKLFTTSSSVNVGFDIWIK